MQHKTLARILLLLCVALIAIVSIIWRVGQQRAAQALQTASLHFTRSDWAPEVTVEEQTDLQLLGSAFRQAAVSPATPPNQEPAVYRLILSFADGDREYLIMHDLRVFNQTLDQEIFPAASGGQLLALLVVELKKQQFGELLPWSEVSQLIPRYSVFSITDLETGLTFKSQRRAGSQHADIQPLSKADTAIMKSIYGGAWSWNRRAVVVEYAGKRIAASMNGMPHGAGALANGFPGHHCLHFLDSTTHGSDNSDPVHQLMIQKAAGCLQEYLDQLPPADLQILALEMAGQGDAAVIGLLTDRTDGSRWHESANQIRDIRIWSGQVEEPLDGKQVGHYSVSVFFQGDAGEYRANVTLSCRYIGGLGKWLVEPEYLQQLLGAKR